MRKLTSYFLLIFSTLLTTGPSAFSQDLTKPLPKPASYEEAKAYLNKALSNSAELSNPEKINLCLQSDSVFREVQEWEYSIISLIVATKILQLEREYQKIDELSKDAISIAQSHLVEDNPYFGMAYNTRGISISLNKKDYVNAIPLFKEAIDSDKINKVSLLDACVAYFNLGSCYQGTGDYDLAIDQFGNALRIQFDSLNFNDKMIPTLFNQRGLCFSKKNEFEAAIEDFLNGIKYAKKASPQRREVDQIILYLYQNLADLYLKNDQPALAQKYISLALDFQKDQNFIKDSYTHVLQGRIFLKEKKYETSFIAFRNSTTSAQLEYKDFDKHPEIGLTYFYSGNAWLAQNKLDKALEFYQLALISNTLAFESLNPDDNPTLDDLVNPLNAIDVFEGKAKTYTKIWENDQTLKDLKSALENYTLAVKAIAKTRQSFNAEGSKHTLAEKVLPIYEGAIKTAFSLYQATGEQEWLEKGFQFAEGNKAAALFEAIQENEAMGTGNIPDSLLSKEYNLKVDIAFYEKLIHEAKQQKQNINTQKIKDLENSHFEFKESYQKLIDHFEANYSDYYALKFKQELLDIRMIQQKLKQTALLEFFVGAEHIFVFTITDKNLRCERIAKGNDFEKDIKTLRTIITTTPDSKSIVHSLDEFKSSSNRLYKKLFTESLPASAKQLVIVPDDLLAYLPFSLLIDEANPGADFSYKTLPYLFKKVGISYTYSAALWLKHLDKKTNVADKKFFGFAPEFKNYTGADQLSPLPCNISEVEQIGELLNTADLRFNENAKLEDFKNNAANYQVIHLATHTTLDNENSAFNKIYFSDDYLPQNDLYQLQLNASLVVLSACNTGSGELKKGEGVMSLSRGFTHAGCPSVLMSLWSVDDCTTADIMLHYYKALNEGASKVFALQNAKEKYLEGTSDILQAHPYYWAAFVQYGNTASLELNDSSWVYYRFFVIASLVVGFALWLMLRIL